MSTKTRKTAPTAVAVRCAIYTRKSTECHRAFHNRPLACISEPAGVMVA